MGTVSDPVPVAGLAANFSPIPRIAPPPLGRLSCGGATANCRSGPVALASDGSLSDIIHSAHAMAFLLLRPVVGSLSSNFQETSHGRGCLLTTTNDGHNLVSEIKAQSD